MSSLRPSISARLQQPAHDLVLVERERNAALERRAEALEHRVERRRLSRRARKAVEDEAAPRIRRRETLLGHGDHDVVGHEVAAGHHRLRLDAHCGLPGDRVAQHLARGDLRHAESLHQALRLRALPGAGGTQHQKAARTHRCNLPRIRAPCAKPSYCRDTRCASICAIVSRPTPTTIKSAVPPYWNGSPIRVARSVGSTHTAEM